MLAGGMIGQNSRPFTAGSLIVTEWWSGISNGLLPCFKRWQISDSILNRNEWQRKKRILLAVNRRVDFAGGPQRREFTSRKIKLTNAQIFAHRDNESALAKLWDAYMNFETSNFP